MPGKRKNAEDTGSEDKKQKGDKKNKSDTQWDEIDWKSSAKTSGGGTKWNYKVSSWNVDGLRACCTKGIEYIERARRFLNDIIYQFLSRVSHVLQTLTQSVECGVARCCHDSHIL